MIMVTKEVQELFCETDEEVEQILESAKNCEGKELIGKEVKKKIKKFKDADGAKQILEYFNIRLTYQLSTINDIVEEYYM